MKESKLYIYNNIDNTDYFIGVLGLYPDVRNPYYTFKYSDEWLNNKYAYALHNILPLRKKIYNYPLNRNFNVIRYGYVNEIDYYYEFLLLYAIKNNLMDKSLINIENLYNWFKISTPYKAKFLDFYSNVIPIYNNILIQNDFTRCGSIRFKDDKDGPFCKIMNPDLIPNINEIEKIIDIINKIKNNEETPEELEQFAACASSLSGYQPKFNIFDTEGNLFIAKLSSIFDNNFNEIKRELLALLLAKKFNINVQEYSIKKTKNGSKYLLLKRFDREDNKRIPFMYLSNSIKNIDYNDNNIISDIIKSICKNNIRNNLKEFFKRKLFRIIISNTREHLTNTAFLFDIETGWNLSPEFDATCGIYDFDTPIEKIKELYTTRRLQFRTDMLQHTINNYEMYELTRNEVLEIIDNLKFALTDWQQEALNAGFNENELYRIKIYDEALNKLII